MCRVRTGRSGAGPVTHLALCGRVSAGQDVSYEVFMKILEFLYTDLVGEITSELAIPLLIASERYLLERLKGLCEDAIRKSITSVNVVSIFMAAHRHRASDLKVRAHTRHAGVPAQCGIVAWRPPTDACACVRRVTAGDLP